MKRLILLAVLVSFILGGCFFVFDPWTKGSRIVGSLYWSNLAVAANGNVYFYNSRRTLFQMTPEGEISTVFTLDSGGLFGCGAAITDKGNIVVGTERSVQQNGFDVEFLGGLVKISPDGDLIWSFESGRTGSEATGGPSIGGDGKIYIGTHAGTLYCLTPDNRTIVWKVETGRPILVKPAITEDGTVYFGTSSLRTEKQLFYAVREGEENEGEVVWSLETLGESTGFYSSPAIGTDGTVYTGCNDGYLYALCPDGTLLWGFDTTTEQETEPGTEPARAIAASPVIGPDGTIYIATQNGYVLAVSSTEEGAEVLWSKNLDTRISATPLIADNNRIYVVGEQDATLYTLDDNGAILSKRSAGRSTISSPVMSADGTIYFGANLNDIGSSSVVFSVETDSAPAGPWPMFGRDAQRTSRAD